MKSVTPLGTSSYRGINKSRDVVCSGLLYEEDTYDNGPLVAISVVGQKAHIEQKDKTAARQGFIDTISSWPIAVLRPGYNWPAGSWFTRSEFFMLDIMKGEKQVKSRQLISEHGHHTGLYEYCIRLVGCDPRRAGDSANGEAYITGSDLADVKSRFWSFFKGIQSPAPRIWEEEIWNLLVRDGMIKQLTGFNMAGVKTILLEKEIRELISRHWIKSYGAIKSNTTFQDMFGPEILVKGQQLRDRLEAAKKGVKP